MMSQHNRYLLRHSKFRTEESPVLRVLLLDEMSDECLDHIKHGLVSATATRLGGRAVGTGSWVGTSQFHPLRFVSITSCSQIHSMELDPKRAPFTMHSLMNTLQISVIVSRLPWPSLDMDEAVHRYLVAPRKCNTLSSTSAPHGPLTYSI